MAGLDCLPRSAIGINERRISAADTRKIRWMESRKPVATLADDPVTILTVRTVSRADRDTTEDMMRSVTPRLTVAPVLRNVVPIPEATPRRFGGTAVIMVARFGAAKSPIPVPTRTSGGVNCANESDGPIVASHRNPEAEMRRPKTVNHVGPYRSDNQPLTGPNVARDAETGMRNSPAVNGSRYLGGPCR